MRDTTAAIWPFDGRTIDAVSQTSNPNLPSLDPFDRPLFALSSRADHTCPPIYGLKMPNRRDGLPLKISGDAAVRLQRFPFVERRIQEGKLQAFLELHPEILPIEEIDPSFGPLIPIGQEIGTAVGPIDVLFVSREGLLTLAETKLWRNPESRRQVVGQILDYATEMSRWSYSELDQRCRQSCGKTLWQRVTEFDTGSAQLDEGAFCDAVSRNLRRGRFLLLIVGDGIHEEVERMAAFLQGSPQLGFQLALVELQVYKLDEEDDLLVVPTIVARTVEVPRAVIRIEGNETKGTNIVVTVPEEPMNTRESRMTTDETQFFERLTERIKNTAQVDVVRKLLDRATKDDRLVVEWGASSFTIKLRDPLENSRRYTVLVVPTSGNVYVGWLFSQLQRVGMDPQPGVEYVAAGARLLGKTVHPKRSDDWDSPVSLSVFASHLAEYWKLIERLATEVTTQRLAMEPQTQTVPHDGP